MPSASGPVSLARGLPGSFPGALGTDPRADDGAAVDCLAGFGAHGGQYSRPCGCEQCH